MPVLQSPVFLSGVKKEGLEKGRFGLHDFSHAHIGRSANPALSQLCRAR